MAKPNIGPKALKIPRLTSEQIADFWSHVRCGSPDDCWPWITTTGKSYGTFSINGQDYGAHRIAYTLVKGKITNRRLIMHSCDNPPCCNPSHLSPGSWYRNHRDCVNKERHARGSRIGTSKLSEQQVRTIYDRFNGQNANELATEFGISPGHAYQIGTGKVWRHLWTASVGSIKSHPVPPLRNVKFKKTGKPKLTKEQAQQIHDRYDGNNGAVLAVEFGVSQGTVSHIGLEKTWRELWRSKL